MKSSTIAFRLQADLLEKVDADCKRLKVSRGALVRDGVILTQLVGRNGAIVSGGVVS